MTLAMAHADWAETKAYTFCVRSGLQGRRQHWAQHCVLFGQGGKPQSRQNFGLPSVQFTHGVGVHSVGPHFCGATPQPKALAAQHAPGQSPLGGFGGIGGAGAGPAPRLQLPAATQPMPQALGHGMFWPSSLSVPLTIAHVCAGLGCGQTVVQPSQSQKNMVAVWPRA
jgi:hypothetical protein